MKKTLLILFLVSLFTKLSYGGPWTCEAYLISEMNKRLKKEKLKLRHWACYLDEEKRLKAEKSKEKPMNFTFSKRVFGFAPWLSPYVLGASLAADMAVESVSKKVGSFLKFNEKRENVKKGFCSDPKKRDAIYKKVRYHSDFRQLKKIHNVLSLMLDVRGPWKRYMYDENGKVKMRTAGTREVPVMNYPCGGETFYEFSKYRNTGYQMYPNLSQSCNHVPLFYELKEVVKKDSSIFCKRSWDNLAKYFHKKREKKRSSAYKAAKKWKNLIKK